MSTNNDITLDHIAAYFNLNCDLKTVEVAPTATGGAGFDNRAKYPPPEPSLPTWRKGGFDYVKKYVEDDQEEQTSRRITMEIPIGSTLSIDTIENIDDVSTVMNDDTHIGDLNEEATQQIYTTYFNVENRTYDPDLTITNYRQKILQQLNINPVVIIQGPTGCGKTTQVPQYILDYHQSRGTYCNIVVTQPRKIAAISIARRVCQERKWPLGTIVGYQVAMDNKTSSDTRLSYVTTGVLLEILVNNKRMDMYTHVVIDEIHERNQDTDFALLLVKKFLKTNSQRVKIILMSATFDSSIFSKYFCQANGRNPAPVIEIIGKSKDVTEHYLYELQALFKNKSIPDFQLAYPSIDPVLYDVVIQLMFIFDRIEKAEQNVPADQQYAPSRGSVLIFLPGYEDISQLTNKLQSAGLHWNLWIIPLHSSITVDEQTKVFRSPPPNQRKVIISTNIAESSITVPDIKYVIDFCLTKSLVTDYQTNYTCLQLEWAPQSNCIQRKGRAGRVNIGKVYRMVPRQFYEKLPEYGIPEIKRCPLTSTILHLKKLNLCEPQEMLAFAIDPPDLADIGMAVLSLKEALALTSLDDNPFNGKLTFIGHVMSSLPLDIKFSKLIIFGFIFNCLEECIIMAASLSLQSFFAKPFQKLMDAYRSRLSWADNTFSDLLCYLYAYQTWRQKSNQGFFQKPGGLTEKDWAEKQFIQLRRIKEVDKLVKEITKRLEKHDIRLNTRHRSTNQDADNILLLKMVIAGAFFPFYFIQQPLNEEEIKRELNLNDPHSTVLVTGIPQKHGIVYASQIRDLFASFSPNVAIEFEETKAYIRFPRNSETPTNTVLQHVYLALKMKQLRMPLEIETFSFDDAERKCAQLMATKNEKSSCRFFSNRVTVNCAGAKTLQKAILPAVSVTHFQCFPTYVKDPGQFWVRDLSKIPIMNFINDMINSSQGKNLKPLSQPPEPHGLYLTTYASDGQRMYHRVQVQGLRRASMEAKVFFIDYGNTEPVKFSDLREIGIDMPDVLTTPALAIECSLSELKPSFNQCSTGWSLATCDWFKKKTDQQRLTAEVYSVIKNTVRIDIKINKAHGIGYDSINEQLIQRGFAEKSEESLVSKEDHQKRLEHNNYNTSLPSLVSGDSLLQDVELSLEDTGDLSEIQKSGRRVRLHGPFNPLEASYVGMTNIDRSKAFRVERDSVNSMSMNAEPQDPYTSLLVASSVAVSQNSLELVGRNTTLMPKIRGLPSLICLVFSPMVELRTDKARNSYTGAICGLGYASDTGKSHYPEHDLDIAFDVELTLDDITEINSVRKAFSILNGTIEDDRTTTFQYNQNTAALVHEMVRTKVLQLLRKKWEPRDPELFSKQGQWNLIPDDYLLRPEENVEDEILPVLITPSLLSFYEKNKEMQDHLRILYDMAINPTREYQVILCKLCGVDVRSTRDLLVHLNGESHGRKERNLEDD